MKNKTIKDLRALAAYVHEHGDDTREDYAVITIGAAYGRDLVTFEIYSKSSEGSDEFVVDKVIGATLQEGWETVLYERVSDYLEEHWYYDPTTGKERKVTLEEESSDALTLDEAEEVIAHLKTNILERMSELPYFVDITTQTRINGDGIKYIWVYLTAEAGCVFGDVEHVFETVPHKNNLQDVSRSLHQIEFKMEIAKQ